MSDKKRFAMSMYIDKETLYKEKSEYYMELCEELEQKLSDAEKQNELDKAVQVCLEAELRVIKRQNEWVSVEDDLPEKGRYQENTPCLVYGENLILRVGLARITSDGLFSPESFNFDGRRITHWKPITPPEVDKDER